MYKKRERGRGRIKTARGEKLQTFAIKTFLSPPVSNLNVVTNRNMAYKMYFENICVNTCAIKLRIKCQLSRLIFMVLSEMICCKVIPFVMICKRKLQ